MGVFAWAALVAAATEAIQRSVKARRSGHVTDSWFEWFMEVLPFKLIYLLQRVNNCLVDLLVNAYSLTPAADTEVLWDIAVGA